MVRFPYHPYLTGLALGGNIGPMALRHLEILKKCGINSIGFEPTFQFDSESLARLAEVARETKTNSDTCKKLDSIIHILENSNAGSVFEPLKQVAAKMGFNVIDLGNRTLTHAINKTIWRRLRDKIQNGEAFDTQNRPHFLVQIAQMAHMTHFEYPSGYVLFPLHIKSLIQQANKKEPEAIIVSAAHAPEMIRRLKIPYHKITWVSHRFILSRPDTIAERRAMLPLMKQMRKWEQQRRRILKEREKIKRARRRITPP